MLPLHTILCPLDFSESSYKALESAVEMAAHFEAELVLVHVTPAVSGIPADPAYVFEGPKGYKQEQETAAVERLTLAANQITPGVKTRTAVANGDAADEIVRLANVEGVDLIVISTHGSTGWRHLVFGSVAEKIIRLADRPVLVIPVHEPKK